MQESTGGATGGFGFNAVDLDDIARQDQKRSRERFDQKARTHKRKGTAHSRQWGFATYGTGKRS